MTRRAKTSQFDEELSRRRALELAGITGTSAFMGGLAGCMGGGGGDGGSGTADSFEFLHSEPEPQRKKVFETIASRFEEESGITPNITVLQEQGYTTELINRRQSNTLPAVGWAEIPTMTAVPDMFDKERAKESIQTIGEDKFYDPLLKLANGGSGDYWAVPTWACAGALVYRKSAFEKLGLERPDTWDKVRTAAKTIHEDGDVDFGIGFPTQKVFYAPQWLMYMGLPNGARMFDNDGNVIFDSSEMVETLELFQELIQYSPPGRLGYGDIISPYLNEELDFFFFSSFMMTRLVRRQPEMVDDTGFVFLMENREKKSWGCFNAAPYFKGVDEGELEAGQKYIEFFSKPNNWIELAHAEPGGFQPVRKDIAEMDAYQDNEVVQAYKKEFSEDIPNAMLNMDRFEMSDDGSFYGEDYGAITSELMIAEALGKIYFDNADPQAVATEYQQKMAKAVEELRNS